MMCRGRLTTLQSKAKRFRLDIAKFLTDYWSLVVGTPVPFSACATLSGIAGFTIARTLYVAQADNARSHAEVSNTRLELARDDLARLERTNSEGEKHRSHLRIEVAALRADIAQSPQIVTGKGLPPEGLAEGTLYLRLEPQ